jgi:predicted DNA-binding transcriptional regulator YafY
MRASRLLTILVTLQMRGRVTARELAEQLEVSRRTIYRDVDELSAAGVPIYADRGPSGGFALLGGFRTELTGLTAEESDALLLAGVPAAAADLGLAGAASAARLKMLASLAPEARDGANRVAGRFHLDLAEWYARPRPPEHLRAVARCVWENRRLAMRYESWKRTTRTVVEPLGLVLKAGRWYLVAAREGSDGIYRLDKALEVKPLEEVFERPQEFDLATTWRAKIEQFEQELHTGKARLRVAPSAFHRLSYLGDAIAEPVLAAAPGPDGRHEASVPIESISHAAGLLLGFADEIEVLDPPELRQEVARRAAAVLALYGAAPKEAH